jgi:hypothetical protein
MHMAIASALTAWSQGDLLRGTGSRATAGVRAGV